MYLEKIKQGKNTYLRLVECYRDPDTHKNRKRIIKNYGNYEALLTTSPDLVKQLEDKYSGLKRKSQEQKSENFQRLVQTYAQELNNEGTGVLLNYSGLMLHDLWEGTLGMSEFFRYLKNHDESEIQFSPSKLTYYLSLLKMVEPQSHYSAYSSLCQYIGVGISELELSSVYRCLDYLYEHKEQLLSHINRQVEKEFSRDYTLLFYDTTNCYFESPIDDEQLFTRYSQTVFCEHLREEGFLLEPEQVTEFLKNNPDFTEIYEDLREEYGEAYRMRGLSKEMRFDLPIVSVALVIDSNAIPIDFMVFAGNKSEKTNMVNSIKRLKQTYNISNAVVVADSGLNSTNNMHMMLKEGFGYAMSKSVLSLPKKMEDDIIDLSKYETKLDEQGKEIDFKFRVIEHTAKYVNTKDDGSMETIVIKNKMLLTFSKKRQKHDLAVLEEKYGKAVKAVASGSKLKLKDKGYSSLVSADIDTKKLIAKKIKNALVEKHRKRAGFAAVIYHDVPSKEQIDWLKNNISGTLPDSKDVEPKIKYKDLAGVYHKLVQIEECFRIMKTNFSIRPMYVRNIKRITAHVLICVISLIMLRFIQKELEKAGKHLSVNEICTGLRDAEISMTTMNNLKVFEKQTRQRLNVLTTGEVLGYKKNYTEILMENLKHTTLKYFNSEDDLRQIFKVKSLSIFEPKKKELI